MAIVTSGSDSEESSSTFTFDYGFSPVSGNILVVEVTRNTGTDDINTPTGWAKIFSSVHGSAVTAVFWRLIGESEPIFQEFTSAISQKWAGGITEFSGRSATPIDTSASGTGISTAPSSSTVTPSVDNCDILAGFGTNDQVTMTVEGTLTERWNQQSTGGGACGTAGGTLTQTTAAATGAINHSLSSSKDWFAYTIALAPASDTILIMDSGDITLSGTDATFITDSTSSEAQSKWFNPTTWKSPTFGTSVWGTLTNLTLAMDSGDVSLSGTDASFSVIEGTLTLTMDSADISLSGTDADFTTNLVVTAAQVQGELDTLLQENTVDISDKMFHGTDYYVYYCVGNVAPYQGKAMWVRTNKGDSAALQAADIASVMLQDGNSDPNLS